MATINRNEQLMVGADPEFLIINPDNGNLVLHNFFDDTNSFGNIGSDCSNGEIRPTPGSPRQVTENIRALIQASLKSNYKNMILMAGGGAERNSHIGGHIHFNVFWDRYSDDQTRHLKLLDRYIGIPLKALPGGQRYGTCYGYLSGYDTKDYGFEYRTPPSWLTDPGLTEAVLSVGYLITQKFMADPLFRMENDAKCTESELELLIPTEGPFKRYWAHQVHSYAEYIFSNFNLAAEDMRERWDAPAIIEWKRTDTMVDLMGAFKARVAAALAETRRLEAERAAVQAERQRALEAERLERENRARDVAAMAAATAGTTQNVFAKERAIWARLSNSFYVAEDTTKRSTQRYSASVFIHRHIRAGADLGYRTEISEQTSNLNIGFLKVIEHSDDYEGWSEHYKNRVGNRYRRIRQDNSIVYMSIDLKPLVKRTRWLPFKIKFVEFRGPQGISPRTVSFHRNSDRSLNRILILFMSCYTKRWVPQSFYAPENAG